jgi:TatD DNase family protein
MRYLDTHCHLNDPKFASDLSDVISKVKAAGCLGCFNNADSLASFQPILQLAKDYPHFCYAVLGIHPEFAVKEDSYQEEAIAFVKAHLGDIKAIGEIGLDYHYSPPRKKKSDSSRSSAAGLSWLKRSIFRLWSIPGMQP